MFVNLTRGGQFFASINGFDSQLYDLQCGTGQGDPASTLIYNIQHALWNGLATQLVLKSLPNSVVDIPYPNQEVAAVPIVHDPPDQNSVIRLPSLMFRDNTTHFSRIRSRSEAAKFRKAFAIAQICTGLRINFDKTQILLVNKHLMSPVCSSRQSC